VLLNVSRMLTLQHRNM